MIFNESDLLIGVAQQCMVLGLCD